MEENMKVNNLEHSITVSTGNTHIARYVRLHQCLCWTDDYCLFAETSKQWSILISAKRVRATPFSC